jgi:endo-1,4-beta-xylanase
MLAASFGGFGEPGQRVGGQLKRHTVRPREAPMERILIAIVVVFYTCAFDRIDADSHPQAMVADAHEIAPGLRRLAVRSGLLVGAAVAAEPLRSDEEYRTVLAREYNVLVPENALKFGNVHPEPERYDFSAFEEILAFAESNDMCVRGHTLVWHRQLPSWIEQRAWTRDELTEVLRAHIHAVVGRYRGRVHYWDVVNEAISDFWGSRSTVWSQVIGSEYIELAFRFAHEADPDALLFYNDYGTEGLGRKSTRMYELVSNLLERDVPIHGVGLQAHVNQGIPRAGELVANLRRLEELGLQIHLTEVDVGVPQPTTDLRLVKQAILYQRLMDSCLAVRGCNAFVTWGFTDAHSWVPSFFPGLDAALPFDSSLHPKPSYGVLAGSLKASSRTAIRGLTRRCS